ncbi:hypothetical protein J437_LFUL004678 [Ladona fulva]|uniref:Uncharacterized protein n=1 Tax=Ladona fulva TaxID=123851 RepID=A0A8K0KTS9_LADFU|nr:hypothetical protein J437_LFUL004678 [Ladona fulva]
MMSSYLMKHNGKKVDEGEKTLPVQRGKFDRALKKLKEKRAPGIDGIAAEIIKNAGEIVQELLRRVNIIFIHGQIPMDFEKSKIVPIPKKTKPDR